MGCKQHDTGLETGFSSETPVRILPTHVSVNWVFCGYLRNCLRGQPDEYIALHRQLCNITSRIMKRVVTFNISVVWGLTLSFLNDLDPVPSSQVPPKHLHYRLVFHFYFSVKNIPILPIGPKLSLFGI